jgi:hypothetical protein
MSARHGARYKWAKIRAGEYGVAFVWELEPDVITWYRAKRSPDGKRWELRARVDSSLRHGPGPSEWRWKGDYLTLADCLERAERLEAARS